MLSKKILRPPSTTQKAYKTMSHFLENKSNDYTADSFVYLSHNEHGRYPSNSTTVGHAIITRSEQGLTATQYSLPQPEKQHLESPFVVPLTNIQQVTGEGISYYIAQGPYGESYVSRRSHQLLHNDEVLELAYFSEDDMRQEHKIKRTKREKHNLGSKVKNSEYLSIDAQSIIKRESQISRGKSQNEVMNKKSAAEEFKDLARAHPKKLTSKVLEHVNYTAHIDYNNCVEKKYRPEWLHLSAHSLTPEQFNPQCKQNLAAAPAWANTEMMILENFAKWFALTHPGEAKVKIKGKFELLLTTNVINNISYEVFVQNKEHIFRLIEEIDPLQEQPILHKASDLAQMVGITSSIFNKQMPFSSDSVSILSAMSEEPQLQQVPMTLPAVADEPTDAKVFTIIDLETTGLIFSEHQIIEIALLSVSYSVSRGILSIREEYTALNDPKEPLSEIVKKVTHLTDNDLAAKSIDWHHVLRILEQSEFIVCHNSSFDRKFLEAATPQFIQNKIKIMPFGCTLKDIDWVQRGCEGSRLKYLEDIATLETPDEKLYQRATLRSLNLQLGFEFSGHRALNDCFATLNLIRQAPNNALVELVNSIHESKTLVCATNTPYKGSDRIRKHNFFYEKEKNPQGWYKTISAKDVPIVEEWFNEEIYMNPALNSFFMKRMNINAVDRYSIRAESLAISKKRTQNDDDSEPHKMTKLS